jgi:hypothetical protein
MNLRCEPGGSGPRNVCWAIRAGASPHYRNRAALVSNSRAIIRASSPSSAFHFHLHSALRIPHSAFTSPAIPHSAFHPLRFIRHDVFDQRPANPQLNAHSLTPSLPLVTINSTAGFGPNNGRGVGHSSISFLTLASTLLCLTKTCSPVNSPDSQRATPGVHGGATVAPRRRPGPATVAPHRARLPRPATPKWGIN